MKQKTIDDKVGHIEPCKHSSYCHRRKIDDVVYHKKGECNFGQVWKFNNKYKGIPLGVGAD